MKRITLLFVFLFLFSAITIAQHKKYVSRTVKEGENLRNIAREYDISFKDLMRLNPDVSRNPEPNTVIIVPNKSYGKKVMDIVPVPDKFYLVKPKETLYGISKMFGVSMEALTAANPDLKNGLKIGMELAIPKASKATLEENIDYEFHRVVKDDTLYNLSKRYHITQAELIRLNPSLKYGLKIGLELVVPKISETDRDDVVNYLYHSVVKDDTMFNLSNRYQVSQPELLSLNPALADGLKLGMLLKIKAIQKSAYKNDADEDIVFFYENFDTSEEINVVFMLPYHSNMLSDSTRNENFRKNHSLLNIVTDFHLGATMAIDSLRDRGLRVKVKFMDTENSTQKLQVLINRNDFKNVDVVIGPLFFDNAHWISKHVDVPVIVPFYSKNQSAVSANNLVKAAPETNLRENRLFHYLEKKYQGENILVINDGKPESQTKLWQIVNRLKAFENIQNIAVVKSEDGYISNDKFLENLKDNADNWVLLVSDEMVTTASAVNNLKSFIDNHKITLIALDKGKNFGSIIDNNLLGQLNFMYPSIDFLDVDDAKVNNFYKSYQEKNYAIPSKYALKGFDITYDVLARIATMGSLEQGLMAGKSSMLATPFRYDRNLLGSYENQGIYIVQYNTSLTPIILE